MVVVVGILTLADIVVWRETISCLLLLLFVLLFAVLVVVVGTDDGNIIVVDVCVAVVVAAIVAAVGVGRTACQHDLDVAAVAVVLRLLVDRCRVIDDDVGQLLLLPLMLLLASLARAVERTAAVLLVVSVGGIFIVVVVGVIVGVAIGERRRCQHDVARIGMRAQIVVRVVCIAVDWRWRKVVSLRRKFIISVFVIVAGVIGIGVVVIIVVCVVVRDIVGIVGVIGRRRNLATSFDAAAACGATAARVFVLRRLLKSHRTRTSS